jgi:hypothetical protein
LTESSILPQIALGIRDVGGTGLFGSEYLVLSKNLKRNIDLTMGIGWGKLSGYGNLKNPLTYISQRFKNREIDQGLGGKVSTASFLSGDIGLFGGIEYTLPRFHGLKVKLEIDGTDYLSEGPLPIKQSSKLNFGVVYPITKGFHTKFSFTKGNTVNFGFSYNVNFLSKNPRNLVKEKNISVPNNEIVRSITARSEQNLNKASLLYLRQRGYSLQKTNISSDTLEVVYSQSKYRSPSLAAGRAVNILDEISPDNIKNFIVSEVNGGIGMYTLKIDRDSYKRYKAFNAPEVAINVAEIDGFKFVESDYQFNPEIRYPAYFASLSPDLRSQIGGPDGFYFGDLKISMDSEVLFSRNLSLIGVFSYGIYDNMDTLKLGSDSVLPRVRTDIVQYLKQSREFSVRRLQLNHYSQLSKSNFLKISGGIFESMFGGIGFEYLYRPFNKSYGISIEAWDVMQREYDQMFEFKDYRTITGHATFYYHHDKSNILFKIKGGRYLAKDSGFTFDASRIFRSGYRVGAFFSLTDISFEEFGEGSFDKGFYFWIPLDLFSGRYFRRTWGWGLKPVTRDGAQSLVHGYPLWGVTDSANISLFNRTKDDFYD